MTTIEAEAVNREGGNAELIAALGHPDPSGAESSWDMEVLLDEERGRWIAVLGADAIGELTYRFVGGRVVLLSTWVDHNYRNHRVAAELMRRVLDQIRDTGRKITVICPVVGEFLARNTPYLDLVDDVHTGVGAYPRRDRVGGADGDELGAFVHDVS